MKDSDGFVIIERKLRSVGVQMRWWGTVIFIAGVVMAILELDSGIVISALGVVMALQGAILQYVFRK